MKNRFKAHMRLVKRCKKRFIEKLDWELYQLLEMNKILSDYDKGFEIESRLEHFTAEVKLRLFHLYFNQKLLAFLWHKIQKSILKDHNFRIFDRDSEPSIFGTRRGNNKTNVNTPVVNVNRNFNRKTTKDSIDDVEHVKNSFNKFRSGEILTPRHVNFLTNDEIDGGDDDYLPGFEAAELKLRFKQALEYQVMQIRRKSKRDDLSSSDSNDSISVKENYSKKKKNDLKSEGRKLLIDIKRFKRTRKKLRKDKLNKVIRRAKEFELTKVLAQLERLKEVKKAEKRIKKLNKRNKSKSNIKDKDSTNNINKEISSSPSEKKEKNRLEIPRIKVFTIEQLKHIAEESERRESFSELSIVSREIQDLEDEGMKSGFITKMRFEFDEVEARCIILAFFRYLWDLEEEERKNRMRLSTSPRRRNFNSNNKPRF